MDGWLVVVYVINSIPIPHSTHDFEIGFAFRVVVCGRNVISKIDSQWYRTIRTVYLYLKFPTRR